MKRFICHFLIVWLALLSGGAHAHAHAQPHAHAAGHAAVHGAKVQAANADIGASATLSQATEKIDVTSEKSHTDACSLSHCGHAHVTGMLPTAGRNLDDSPGSAALPVRQPWASGELPNNIERPKWDHTTPTVVNL